MTDKELIIECRKRGLQNGASLGSHSGFMDLVADRLEELIEENKKARIETAEEFAKRAKRVLDCDSNAIGDRHMRKLIDNITKEMEEEINE